MEDTSSDDEEEEENYLYRSDSFEESQAIELQKKSTPFVDLAQFNAFIGAVILINAFALGTELDVANPDLPPSKRASWYAAEFVFCTIFVMELFARMWYHKSRYFSSMMNLLDFALVSIQVLETWFVPLLAKGLGVETNMRVFSILRVLRMLKLIRLLRLLTIFHELHAIIQRLYDSLKIVSWILCLLILALYMGAVMLTSQVGHNDDLYDSYYAKSQGWDHEHYFGTVRLSMFSLLQVITLDGWAEEIARHTFKNQPVLSWFFILFIIVTSYGLISIITAVIIEHTVSSAKYEKDINAKLQEEVKVKIFENLRMIFRTADKDKSGTVTINEVCMSIENPEVCSKLERVGFPVNSPEEIFSRLDVNHCGKLTIDEFVNGCKNLTGEAMSKCLLEIQIDAEALGTHLLMLDKKFMVARQKIELLDMKTNTIARQSSEMFGNGHGSRKLWRR